MISAPVETEPSFAAGKPEVLFEKPFFTEPYGDRSFDVSPDGKRFVMASEKEYELPAEIAIVQEWFRELNRLAPRKTK